VRSFTVLRRGVDSITTATAIVIAVIDKSE
jgi:hypothetical protein